MKVISNYLSHCMSGTASMAQAAAVEALTGPQDSVEAMRQEFQARRDYMYARIENIPGVSAIKSPATFYMFMNLDGYIGKKLYGVPVRDADDFANLLLEKGLVAEAEAYEKTEKAGKTAPSFQFMRLGYFCMDNKDSTPEHMVFNRSVSLKDSFKK